MGNAVTPAATCCLHDSFTKQGHTGPHYHQVLSWIKLVPRIINSKFSAQDITASLVPRIFTASLVPWITAR